MVGDDMAILSGGMYGNPESDFSRAVPSSLLAAAKTKMAVGSGMQFLAPGMKMFGSALATHAADKQFSANIAALREERQYNLENFNQRIADQVASNKISFYSSGLDYTTGTAAHVTESNRAAAEADKAMMLRNYDTQIKSLKEQRKANEMSGYFNIAASAFSII